MTWDDDFMCLTGSTFSEMRLLVEGAIRLFEDDAGCLLRLARDAEKHEAKILMGSSISVQHRGQTLRLVRLILQDCDLQHVCTSRLSNTSYTNHDFRASYATWLKESGVEISSAADLMGHKDTRMMSRVYAPTRHESIIAHQNLINSLVENQLVVPA